MPGSCTALAKNGAACRMPPLAGQSTCWSHCPSRTEQRAQARSQGGRSRSLQIDRAALVADKEPPSWWQLSQVADLRSALAFVAQELLAGRLAARDANAAVGVLTALVAIQRDVEIERRLCLLENASPRRQR